jgi:hypothetical protein
VELQVTCRIGEIAKKPVKKPVAPAPADYKIWYV